VAIAYLLPQIIISYNIINENHRLVSEEGKLKCIFLCYIHMQVYNTDREPIRKPNHNTYALSNTFCIISIIKILFYFQLKDGGTYQI